MQWRSVAFGSTAIRAAAVDELLDVGEHGLDLVAIGAAHLPTSPGEVHKAVQKSSPGWTRTNNPPVNSRMLCQLSYRGRVLSGLKSSRG